MMLPVELNDKTAKGVPEEGLIKIKLKTFNKFI